MSTSEIKNKKEIFNSTIIYGLLTGLAFITLTYDFISLYYPDRSISGVALHFLTKTILHEKVEPGGTVLLIFLTIFMFSALISGSMIFLSGSYKHRGIFFKSTLLWSMIVVTLFMLYLIIHSRQVIETTSFSQQLETSEIEDVSRISSYTKLFFLNTLLLMVFLGFFISLTQGKLSFKHRLKAISAISLIFLITTSYFLISKKINMNYIKADVYFDQGAKAAKIKNWDMSIFYLQKAIECAPQNDSYYTVYANAIVNKALNSKSRKERDLLFRHALSALEKAQELNPFNVHRIVAQFGSTYRKWSVMDGTESEVSKKRLYISANYLSKAVTLSPKASHLQNELGEVYQLSGNYEKALFHYRKALLISPTYTKSVLNTGKLYMTMGIIAGKAGREKTMDIMLGKAMNIFQEVLLIEKNSITAYGVTALRGMGFINTRQGNIREAIETYKRLISLDNENIEGYLNLATLFNMSGEKQKALFYAQKALDLSSDTLRPQIEVKIKDIKSGISKEGE